jgi:hypothetical protein
MFETPSEEKRKRPMTPFLAQEMLYDLIAGNLSDLEKSSVERVLEQNRETKAELEALKRGLDYCESLHKIQTTPYLVRHVQDSQFEWKKVLGHFNLKTWPAPLRWGFEAVAVSFIVGIIGISVPWNKIRDWNKSSGPSSYVITQTKIPNTNAEVAKFFGKMPRNEEETDLPGDIMPANKQEKQAMEKKPEPEIAAPAVPSLNQLPKVEPPKPPTVVYGPVPPPVVANPPPTPAKPIAKAAPPPAENLPIEDLSEPKSDPDLAQPNGDPFSDPNAVEESSMSSRDEELKGWVYRGFVNSLDVGTSAEAITQKIQALGGEKAGEVELGWKRGKGRYYHFTVPQSNYAQLMSFLKTFGPVRIYRDRHRRVMPETEIRFILWVAPRKK